MDATPPVNAAPTTPPPAASAPVAAPVPAPDLSVSPGPHIHEAGLSTRRMMFDVVAALIPLVMVALWLFGRYAAWTLLITVGATLLAEAAFASMRRRRPTLGDGSALVTGLILGLSLPPGAPWYVGAVGGFAAIGLAKALYGGLGQNLFNPAMVGRAFVMIAFPAAVGASAYVIQNTSVDVLSGATPLTAMKMEGRTSDLLLLFLGRTNGSLGETSALGALVGGLFLCARRSAAWQIPAGALLSVLVFSGLGNLMDPDPKWTVFHQLSSGAFMLGAFYIITDPVTSPLTVKGRWIFGAGFGALVLLIRAYSGYPEGVMFAVLIMNSLVPLINRQTVPVPVGGPVPVKK